MTRGAARACWGEAHRGDRGTEATDPARHVHRDLTEASIVTRAKVVGVLLLLVLAMFLVRS
jgi:hypothetical protein